MTQKIITFLLSALLAGCSASTVERRLTSVEAFGKFSAYRLAEVKLASPYLKAHMNDGSIYVFSAWESSGEGSPIAGTALRLGPLRDSLFHGPVNLALDSVALLETNMIGTSGSSTGLTLLTGISAAATIFCIANPKACFGSCPTFYVSDGESLRLQAEGFSSSIAPALEATDIDALFRAHPTGADVAVEMRNEALETHVVRHVDLLAVPRAAGERVFADARGGFWSCASLLSPLAAAGPEGDCRSALADAEGTERWSLADGEDLSAKETIDLEFRVAPGRSYGLVLGCRQALLPTYLLYQALAYMGSDAGHWLAEIERGHISGKESAMEGLIGGIEIATRSGGDAWQSAGSMNEHGPLARDMHLTPIGSPSDTAIGVRLRLTKGAWRLDYVALAELSGSREPIRISPSQVMKDGEADAAALAALLDPAKTLVTQPGDVYTMRYTLPDPQARYELFLESRGYYFEWMRKEWIDEENPALLAQMFLDPDGALRRMAPEYKRVEATMEECFWGSRYAKP